MTDIGINDLTTATLGGSGVFDVLMRATKVHLDGEFDKNRIRGPEYATVYLGSLDAVMRNSLEFLLQSQRISLEAQLLEQQVLLAQVGVLKANAELAIIEASLTKIPLEIAQLEAQTGLITQQTANTLAELAIINANALKIPAEVSQITAQTALVTQQKTNLVAEALNIPKQGQMIDAQKAQVTQQIMNMVSEELGIVARTSLTSQQTANAVIEATVLQAQQCKLAAEYDLAILQKTKITTETSLLTQKVATEKAQTTTLGVDADSVIGKQKALYQAQSDGFARDAEQKAAKLMADTWNVRRTTDEATVADSTNMLSDVNIGRAISKLLSGVGA